MMMMFSPSFSLGAGSRSVISQSSPSLLSHTLAEPLVLPMCTPTPLVWKQALRRSLALILFPWEKLLGG